MLMSRFHGLNLVTLQYLERKHLFRHKREAKELCHEFARIILLIDVNHRPEGLGRKPSLVHESLWSVLRTVSY